MKKPHRPSQAGFTLIELMTVIAIIGVLASIALPSFVKYIRKAKTVEVTVNLDTISALLRSYQVDNGTYLRCPINPPIRRCDKKAMALRGTWKPLPAWEALGFRPEGELYFSYRVDLIKGGYQIVASADLDCDGRRSRYVLKRQNGKMFGPLIHDEIE